MTRFLFLSLLLGAQNAFALSAEEEAMVLNQELEFLTETAKARPEVTVRQSAADVKKRNLADQSLEATYFGESSDDAVTTKAAGPKRRGY